MAESFLALILYQFRHEHPYSMSYQKDQALFDLPKVPHQVVAVVNDTVWARELGSLFSDVKMCFYNPHRSSQ